MRMILLAVFLLCSCASVPDESWDYPDWPDANMFITSEEKRVEVVVPSSDADHRHRMMNHLYHGMKGLQGYDHIERHHLLSVD